MDKLLKEDISDRTVKLILMLIVMFQIVEQALQLSFILIINSRDFCWPIRTKF